MAKIKCGDRVKDPITGFEGIVTSIQEHLHGCRHVCIKPETLHDGKPIDGHWFDEPRVVKVKGKVVPIGDRVKGGPSLSKPNTSLGKK